MDQSLINLVLALSTNTIVHAILEINNVRGKVKRLATYIAGKPYKELALNINTRPKSYGLSLAGFIIFVGIFYLVFWWLNLSLHAALVYIALVLTATYIVMAVLLDKYHVEIERVTRPFKRGK